MEQEQKKQQDETVLTIKQIGNELKSKRELAELTVKDINKITRIRTDLIQAIENGDYSKLNRKVFIVGFIKQYCNILGLDSSFYISSVNKHYDDESSTMSIDNSSIDLAKLDADNFSLKESNYKQNHRRHNQKNKVFLIPIAIISFASLLIIGYVIASKNQWITSFNITGILKNKLAQNISTSSNENNASSDENSISSDENSISPDENSISPDENSISPDENSISPDENSISSDENSISSDENSLVTQKKKN